MFSSNRIYIYIYIYFFFYIHFFFCISLISASFLMYMCIPLAVIQAQCLSVLDHLNMMSMILSDMGTCESLWVEGVNL